LVKNITDFDANKIGDYHVISEEKKYYKHDLKIENSIIFLDDVETGSNINCLYNCFVFGKIKAKEIKVDGDLITFGSIDCKQLKVNSSLMCFGNLNAEKTNVQGECFINSGLIGDLYCEEDIFVNEILEVERRIRTNKNVIIYEGMYGEGSIEANKLLVNEFLDISGKINSYKNIVISENGYIEARNIDDIGQNSVKEVKNITKKIEFEKNNFKPVKNLKECFPFEELWCFKELLKEEFKLFEANFEFEEIENKLDEIGEIFYEFKLAKHKFEKILEFANYSNIKDLNQLVDLLYLKNNTPEVLLEFDITKDVFRQLLDTSTNFVKNNRFHFSSIQEAIVTANKVIECESLINEEIYNLLLSNIFYELNLHNRTLYEEIDKLNFNDVERFFYIIKKEENEAKNKMSFEESLNNIIPSIKEGEIKIKRIAKLEERCKIAVFSEKNIKVIRRCVGKHGKFAKKLEEKFGKKIEFIEWANDDKEFCLNALRLNEYKEEVNIKKIFKKNEKDQLDVYVPERLMGLAIGEKGKNVNLASKLIEKDIKIKSTEG